MVYGDADVVQENIQKETEPNKETSNERQKIQDGQAEKMNEHKESLVEEDSQQSAFASDSVNQSASERNNVVPFYGIWCYASENEAAAENVVLEQIQKGMDAKVFVTTDWSNLNSTVWYVVTAVMYFSNKQPMQRCLWYNLYIPMRM